MGRFFFRLFGFLRALIHPSQWTFGKFVHADYSAYFKINGSVQDEINSTPLANVKVFLLDIGLDHVRSKDPNRSPLFIGMSNASGIVVADLKYSWGTLRTSLGPPIGKFEIWIEQYGYLPQSIGFDIETLPRSGNEITVSLGTLRLQSR